VRIATSSHLSTGVTLGVVGIAVAVGIFSLADRSPNQELAIELSPPADRPQEIDPSTAGTARESPAPPKGPFYASLFAAGATWDLPCRWKSAIASGDDGAVFATERCHVESVEVHGKTASARIGCWDLNAKGTPKPAINTYVMTPDGLYEGADQPSTDGEPVFRPHPVAKSLPKGWGYEEPHGPTSVDAMVWHHGAWCTVEEFESEDYMSGFAQCISRHGIAGTSHTSMFMTEVCGDAP